MQSSSSRALAVRDDKGNILLESERIGNGVKKVSKIPVVRGVVSFISSLVTGVKVLTRSAEVFGEGEPSKFEKWCAEKLKVDVLSVVTFFSVLIGFVLAIALFIFAPQELRILILGENPNVWAKNFLEGGFKILIFIAYILICSLIKDVRRTFMYHGAEHKTISCFENGLELTPENAKKCSRVHDRCGTTFIFFVLFISIVIFALFESLLAVWGVVLTPAIVRILCKIALLPLVAGLSYELLKALSKTKNPIFSPLKAPGLLLQRITTREPDEKMLEVAIASFNEVMSLDADPELPVKKFDLPVRAYKALEEVKKELKKNGIKETAEAEWIVSISAGIKRDEAGGNAVLTKDALTKIEKIVKERITGRPLWYCIGDTDFYGFTIKVDERVLIPRPETELLVENALKDIKDGDKVLDLATGSGAIAIAVAKNCGAKVFATDVSGKAIELAEENAANNGAEIDFIESDLFCGIKDEKFDMIISNPPYIKSGDIDGLQKEIKNFEPRLALDGGADGLDFYRRIIKDAPEHLNKNGKLLLECGKDQAREIMEFLKDFESVEIIKDYEGVERIVRAVL